MKAWECPCGWVNSPTHITCPHCDAPRRHGTPIGAVPRFKPPSAQSSPSPSSGGSAIVTLLVAPIAIFLAIGLLGGWLAAAKRSAPQPVAAAAAWRPTGCTGRFSSHMNGVNARRSEHGTSALACAGPAQVPPGRTQAQI